MAGAQCCDNPPELDPTSGNGYCTDEFGGIHSYITGSQDAGVAVVLITDVFGYDAPLMRKLADRIAFAGFFVVVPDFFKGDPFKFNPRVGPLQEWLQEHPPEKGIEIAKPIIEALRSKGFSAIGAAGICWGGKVAVDLAKHDHICAAVLMHPSFVTIDDIKEVKCHIAIIGAEHDHLTPASLVKQFEEMLAPKELNSYVKIHSGVSHGWTVRYETSDEQACKRAEEAQDELIDWFKKNLKHNLVI